MKYPKEFYNVVALLCLLRCLFPPIHQNFQWLKDIKVLPSSPDLRPVDAQKIQKLAASNRGLDPSFGFELKLHHKWPDFFGKMSKILDFRTDSNLVAFIYTENEQPLLSPINSARRNLTETGPTGAIRQDDLSLEDIDLIDCLWRQDIDAEKGFFASIQPPENQYETDMFLLSEKSLFQGNRLQLSVVGENPHKKSVDFSFKHFDSVYPDEKQEMVKNGDAILKSFTADEQQNILSNFTGIFDDQKMGLTDEDFDPSFLNLLNSSNDNLLGEDFGTMPVNGSQTTPILRNATLASVAAIEDPIDDPAFISTVKFDPFAPLLPPSPLFTEWVPSAHGGRDFLLSALTTPIDVEFDRHFSDHQMADDVSLSFERFYPTDAPLSPSLAMVDRDTSRAYTPPFSDKSSTTRSRCSFSWSTDGANQEEYAVDSSSNGAQWASYPLADTPSTSSDPRFNGRSSPDPFAPSVQSQHNGDSGDGPSTSHVANLHDHPYCTSQQPEAPFMLRSTVQNRPATPDSTFLTDDVDTCLFEPSLKDERLAKQYDIDVPVYDIVNMPYENLQQLLIDNPRYRPEQIDVVRQIRRRGRNKVAARNCRQRRFGAVDRLAVEVDILQLELQALVERKRSLELAKRQELEKLDRLGKKYR